MAILQRSGLGLVAQRAASAVTPQAASLLSFAVAGLASLGLPGLAGFWGEFPAILSAYSPAEGLNEALVRAFMIIASVGTVLAAGYLLWMFQRTAFGTPKDEFANRHIYELWLPTLAPSVEQMKQAHQAAAHDDERACAAFATRSAWCCAILRSRWRATASARAN